MNEQLQSKLVEILSAIQAGTRAASDFAMEQLPEIAQQYVMYGRTQAIMFAALFGALTIAAAYFTRRAFLFLTVEDELDAVSFLGVLVVPASAAVGLAIVTAVWANNALLVILAPKVWLIKELASLVK